MHNKRTMRRSDEILGIELRKYVPDQTPVSDKSLAYKAVQAIGNFWKAVSGDVSIEHRRELAKRG